AVIGLGPYRGTYPPIWVAAHGPRTLRLTGRYGDGWLPTHQMEPEEYANHLREIRSAGFEAGRSMSSFTPSYEMTVVTAEQLAARVESYAAVGLRHVVLRNVGPLIDPPRALPSYRDVGRIIRMLRRK